MSSPVRVLALGAQRLPGLYFVPVAKRSPASPPPGPAGPDADVEHIVTDDVRRLAHIRESLLAAIGAATTKVLFCSFLFADDAIVEALCAAAHRLRGGVYVLTALGKHERPDMLEPDADVDSGMSRQQERDARHERHLRALSEAGAWLRGADDCHAKFCVIDDTLAIVTSANATQEAYEVNPESGLRVRSAEVAAELGRLFAHVWLHRSTFESPPGGRLDVHALPRRAASAWQRLRTGGAVAPVATVETVEPSLLEAAESVIDGARDELTIATYSFIGIKEHQVGNALERALQRGVRMRLLVQPRNHLDGQRECCAWLAGMGGKAVQFFGHARTHAKSIVADRRRALLWTGNLDGEHGWKSGVEVGILTDRADVAGAVHAYIESVIERATHEPLLSPTGDQLGARGAPVALTGEWTLELATGADVAAVISAFSSEPADMVQLREGVGLRAGRKLVLPLDVMREAGVLRVRALFDARIASAARATGLVANCKLNIVLRQAASPPTPTPSPSRPNRRRR